VVTLTRKEQLDPFGHQPRHTNVTDRQTHNTTRRIGQPLPWSANKC